MYLKLIFSLYFSLVRCVLCDHNSKLNITSFFSLQTKKCPPRSSTNDLEALAVQRHRQLQEEILAALRGDKKRDGDEMPRGKRARAALSPGLGMGKQMKITSPGRVLAEMQVE